MPKVVHPAAAAVSRTVPRSLRPTIAHTARQKVPLHHRPARTNVGWAILPMRVMATDHRLRPSCRHRLGVCCVCCAPLCTYLSLRERYVGWCVVGA